MLLDGKKLSIFIKNDLRLKIEKLSKKPALAVILVGNNEASKIYVKNKIKSCEECGIKSICYSFEDIEENKLLDLVDKLNNDENINGILVQLPLPAHINKSKVINKINPQKDVDGFCDENIAGMFLGENRLSSCTPKGIMKLLNHYKIDVFGKNVVIVGTSNIVGKPLGLLMLNAGATVCFCRSSTKDISLYTKTADILIVAAGVVNLINETMIKQGVIIVDVGMNRLDGKKVTGDVNFNSVKDKCKAISPVPGGVGPMTIASLLENTYLAFLKQNNLQG